MFNLNWKHKMGDPYNATDLNRVETATLELEALLVATGYFTKGLTLKTNWQSSDLPHIGDITRLCNNAKALVTAFYLYPDSPTPPVATALATHEGVNDLERILFDLYTIIEKMKGIYPYSGEFFAGED